MSHHVFSLLEESTAPWLFSKWWPEAAGLAAGTLCTALVCPDVPSGLLPMGNLWALASGCTLAVFVSTAAVVYLACKLTDNDGRQTVWGTACLASWFPAQILFLRQNSPWAAVLAAALAVVAIRAVLLRLAPGATPELELPRAVAVAAAVELGAAGICAGNWRWAAVILPVAAALLTWMLTDGGNWPLKPTLRRRRLRLAPAFLLGVVFSAGGLTPYLGHGEGTGGVVRFLRALFGGAGPGGAGKHQAADNNPHPFAAIPERFREGGAAQVEIDKSYPAVILWPEVERYTMLVPPPAASRLGLSSLRQAASSGVLFSGFYTFQRATVRPPKQWHAMHGNPAELIFRTTDRSPLVMEAHQDFARPIVTACCREIRLTMRVEDALPGTVRVGMVVSRTNGAAQSLGWAPLAERVVFGVPAVSPLPEFDRITVRVRLGLPRGDRSARIAVRRFDFVPR